MLKLPKTLPSLESPHFILATPEWLQLSVLLLMGSSSLTALLWVGSLMLDGRAESAHYAVLAIMALVGAGALYPRNWRRWVNFAADRRGIYLSTFSGLFVHVPWPDVGPSTIGIAGIGSNRQRTVILPLRAKILCAMVVDTPGSNLGNSKCGSALEHFSKSTFLRWKSY